MNKVRYLAILLLGGACGEIVNDFYHGKDPTEVFYVREFGENFSVEENLLGHFSVVGKDGMSENFNVSKNPDRDLGHYSQSEEVIKVESVKKVDIVWNIDNSGSMGSYQTALMNNFSFFIEDFAKKEVDFKMAIITTDSAVNRDSGNKLNSVELKKNKQVFISDFKANVWVGTGGSGLEKAFEMTKDFIEGNSAWLRSDALLVIIFVSDEEEGGNEVDKLNIGTNKPVKHYTDAIVNAKGGDVANVRAFSICNRITCKRFSAMSQTTNGLVRYIQDSFSDISKEFGESIVRNLTNLETVFPLNITPSNPANLKVDVDGSAVPKDTTENNGWNYDGTNNAIKFFGSHIPSAGSGIKVYEVGQVEDTFCLSKRIKPGRVSSMVVEVDGQVVPRDTGEVNGWNYNNNCVEFFGRYLPSAGSDISISLPGEINNFLCLKNKLNGNHLDKVEVSVGGKRVPRDTTKVDGWAYNDQNNCIEFFGNNNLSAGDVVNISLGLNYSYCLNKGFDVNKLNDVQVVIGNQTISRDTKGTKGWDYNQGSNCIEIYGDHGLSPGLPVKISWGQTTRFCPNKPLDESKIETVVIKVDGVVVERGGEGVGWDYDGETNCVSFFGERMPKINSKIEVTYTPSYR